MDPALSGQPTLQPGVETIESYIKTYGAPLLTKAKEQAPAYLAAVDAKACWGPVARTRALHLSQVISMPCSKAPCALMALGWKLARF